MEAAAEGEVIGSPETCFLATKGTKEHEGFLGGSFTDAELAGQEVEALHQTTGTGEAQILF